MSTKSKLIHTLALCLMVSFATASAHAEISQRDQQQKALDAFKGQAESETEATAGWQKMKDVAETTKYVQTWSRRL